MHETAVTTFGLFGLLTSQIVNPAKLPWYTYLSPKARSELMNVKPRAVSNAAGFCENETRLMFFAAESPPRRPGLSLLRGSSLLGYVCAARRAGTMRGAMSENALRARCIG